MRKVKFAARGAARRQRQAACRGLPARASASMGTTAARSRAQSSHPCTLNMRTCSPHQVRLSSRLSSRHAAPHARRTRRRDPQAAARRPVASPPAPLRARPIAARRIPRAQRRSLAVANGARASAQRLVLEALHGPQANACLGAGCAGTCEREPAIASRSRALTCAPERALLPAGCSAWVGAAALYHESASSASASSPARCSARESASSAARAPAAAGESPIANASALARAHASVRARACVRARERRAFAHLAVCALAGRARCVAIRFSGAPDVVRLRTSLSPGGLGGRGRRRRWRRPPRRQRCRRNSLPRR